MSKKHFIALADALRALRPRQADYVDVESPDHVGLCEFNGAENQWLSTVDALASFCDRQNPRFDRVRFRDYVNGLCGPNGGKVRPGRVSEISPG